MYRLLLIVAVIVYGSLYPWHFAPQNQSPFQVLLHSWPGTWDIFATRDAILNISVYFPLGVAAFLAMSKKLSRSAAGTAALVAGLILSVTLEIFQVYVPGRVSSIFDVLCNFIGTAAGVLATLRFQSALEELEQRGPRRFEPSAVVLLACWGVYHFFPFLPSINLERLRFELRLLAHPCDSRYCCCTASAYLSGIWAGAAEWFVVALSLEALLGRVRARWLIAALCFRLALRPIVITRPLGPDELLGVLLAVLLWVALREPQRRRATFWMLASAVLLLELAPFHFSAIPGRFSWIPFQLVFMSERETATLDVVRKAFDYGAIVWLMHAAGWSYRNAGGLLAAGVAILAMVQRYLPGREASSTDILVAVLMVLVLWLGDRRARAPSVRA